MATDLAYLETSVGDSLTIASRGRNGTVQKTIDKKYIQIMHVVHGTFRLFSSLNGPMKQSRFHATSSTFLSF
jgi:hypothetical protein